MAEHILIEDLAHAPGWCRVVSDSKPGASPMICRERLQLMNLTSPYKSSMSMWETLVFCICALCACWAFWDYKGMVPIGLRRHPVDISLWETAEEAEESFFMSPPFMDSRDAKTHFKSFLNVLSGQTAQSNTNSCPLQFCLMTWQRSPGSGVRWVCLGALWSVVMWDSATLRLDSAGRVSASACYRSLGIRSA